MGQPDIYRGKLIAVEGWVRSARKKILAADTALGIDHYYILWVRPRESKLGPYCVYCQNIPVNFPKLSNQFTDVNQLVKIQGYFFKIRNYVATDSSVQECPVIIAPNLSVIEPPPYAAARQMATITDDSNNRICYHSLGSNIHRLVRIPDLANQAAVARQVNKETHP
jgi:hypothetical protein